MSASWGQCCLYDWANGTAMSLDWEAIHAPISSLVFFYLKIVVHRNLQHGTILPPVLLSVDRYMDPPQYQVDAMFKQSMLDLSIFLVFQQSWYWEKLECLQYIIIIDNHPNKSIHKDQCPWTWTVFFLTITFPNMDLYQCTYDHPSLFLRSRDQRCSESDHEREEHATA